MPSASSGLQQRLECKIARAAGDILVHAPDVTVSSVNPLLLILLLSLLPLLLLLLLPLLPLLLLLLLLPLLPLLLLLLLLLILLLICSSSSSACFSAGFGIRDKPRHPHTHAPVVFRRSGWYSTGMQRFRV